LHAPQNVDVTFYVRRVAFCNARLYAPQRAPSSDIVVFVRCLICVSLSFILSIFFHALSAAYAPCLRYDARRSRSPPVMATFFFVDADIRDVLSADGVC